MLNEQLTMGLQETFAEVFVEQIGESHRQNQSKGDQGGEKKVLS